LKKTVKKLNQNGIFIGDAPRMNVILMNCKKNQDHFASHSDSNRIHPGSPGSSRAIQQCLTHADEINIKEKPIFRTFMPGMWNS
jgi:hypothetical protein